MKENIKTTFKPPFTIVSYEENNKEKHFIAVGKMRVETEYDTFEECEEQINKINWELVTLLIESYTNYLREQENGRNTKNH